MQLFSWVRNLFSNVEEWQICVVFVALPILWFFACCPLRSGAVFATFSEILVALCAVLLICTYGVTDGLLFSVLIAAECLLFRRLVPKRKPPKEKSEPREKEEKPLPRKIVCYPPSPAPEETETFEPATHTVEEANLCLDHAFEVAARLKAQALTGSDRLEADNVELTLRMYRAKGVLTDGEMRSLNDCLAVLLKLTAKYEC